MVVLILLSQLKHDVLFMTVNFVDVMIIDTDTFAFLLTVFPDLHRHGRHRRRCWPCRCSLLIWWLDPLRVRLRTRAARAARSASPARRRSRWYVADATPTTSSSPANYVSKFARSGVTAIAEYVHARPVRIRRAQCRSG